MRAPNIQGWSQQTVARAFEQKNQDLSMSITIDGEPHHLLAVEVNKMMGRPDMDFVGFRCIDPCVMSHSSEESMSYLLIFCRKVGEKKWQLSNLRHGIELAVDYDMNGGPPGVSKPRYSERARQVMLDKHRQRRAGH